MSAGKLRVAIVSDLHAFVNTPDLVRRPSHLCVTESGVPVDSHPIDALTSLIKKEKLQADILLGPGDLGDKASPSGIKYAWESLNKVKDLLGSTVLAATTGNHDVDSYHIYHPVSADEVLKDLFPPYPLGHEDLNDHYWSRKYAIIEGTSYRLVVLNSSAHHGQVENEKNHGRVLEKDISKIKAKIEQLTKRPVNILLCHHHPQPHSEAKLGFKDVIEEGQLLLDMLGNGHLGHWLVIHGHKHHPKITYAAGSAMSPVVLSAGSLSAELYLELSTLTRNQFHIVTLDIDEIQRFGMAGLVNSWTWTVGGGWIPAPLGTGLPSQCGFGFRGSLLELAGRIATSVKKVKLKWPELQALVPEVDRLIPQDFQTVKRLLKVDHKLQILDDDGIPKEIGKTS